jgi:hypothetical protein
MTASHPTLAAALVAAQAEMPTVAKDGANPHFRSRFVTLDALIAATRPILNKHGLSIAQGAGGSHAAVTLTTTIQHESGESWGLTMPIYPAKPDMQALGAAITYARRYGWAAILGIAAEEDDDHESASDRAAAGPQPQFKAPPNRSDEPATAAQMTLLSKLMDEGGFITPETPFTRATANATIEKLKAGTYDDGIPF